MLLEREAPLAILAGGLSEAAGGAGSMVLVAGEAGVGKTSMVRAFCERDAAGARVWWGACDDLSTPSPLGPLHDIARHAGDTLAGLLRGDHSRHEIFDGMLAALSTPPLPVVMVIEDVHWADAATLDLLIFLARRIGATGAVVVVTYRADEVGADHPLRILLGRLATLPRVTRIPLRCLSEPATAELVRGHGVDPARAYQVTGGNPFFVTELLAAPPDTVPDTVRDTVLLRVSRLSVHARAVLNAVAVTPDRAELAMVAAVTGRTDPDAVAECEQAGVLQVTGRTVRFRHELTRQAVEQAIPAARVPGLHAAVLAHLASRPDADPARLAYHAERAHDRAALLVHAPVAAARASRLGAHREAFAHYRAAICHADALPAAERADLLEAYAEECSPIGRIDEAITALGRAAALRHELADPTSYARAQVRRAQYLHVIGRGPEGHELADQAMAQLAGVPASPALTSAYAHAAYLGMLRQDAEGTRALAARACELAERYDDQRLLAVALLAMGNVLWRTDPAGAEATLARAVEAAHRSGRVAGIASALGEVGVGALENRRYHCADRRLSEAIDWAVRHDLDASRDYFRAAQALSHFEQGRWSAAAALAGQLTGGAQILAPARATARLVEARLAVRRGAADQSAPLADVWTDASSSGAPWRMCAAAAARAEAAWFAGQAALIPGLIGDTLQLARTTGDPWAVGELGFWLWRAGAITEPPDGAAKPYARHMRGDLEGAAAVWDRIGCPYEAATVRGDSDDPQRLRTALEAFYRLGARPAANRLVHRMRRLGISGLPRRPHRSTGDNPAHLTDRELEVATLLAEGHSNADIAARLHISPRTAGHHVAAIMAKFEVSNRYDAARAAQRLGIGSRPARSPRGDAGPVPRVSRAVDVASTTGRP